MARERAALSLIVLSSAISAAITWAVLLVAARTLGPDVFAEFLVVWGLFFGLTGVLAGLQQEVTRAAFSGRRTSGATLATGVAIVAVVGGAMVFSTSSAWASRVFGQEHVAGAGVLALAFVGYGAANLVNGVLASRRMWTTYSLLIAGESVLRALVILFVLQTSAGSVGWAVAMSAGLAMWILLGCASASVRSSFRAAGDAPVGVFVRRSLQSMAASACSAAMVTGFPTLVHLLGSGSSGAHAGVVFATVLATRAPVLILVTAFQGPIIRHLIRAPGAAPRSVVRWLWWGALAMVPGIGAAYFVGPTALRLLFGGDYVPNGSFVAIAALGVGLLSGMTIAGWLMLALRRHGLFLSGWLLALSVTTVCLSFDLSIESRAGLALVIGPGVGLALYVASMAIGGRTRLPASGDSVQP